jgi:hypothetical protein
MAADTLANHPTIVNVIWLCFGLFAGLIFGGLWGRWKTLRELGQPTAELTESEMALINADRRRRTRHIRVV